MKDKVSKFIDLCKQYMNKELEQELDHEIRFYESTEGDDYIRTLEYLYDLSETVRTFNDYLCIVFLNLVNILTYPNETIYEKYKNKEIRITPDKAVYMANKICKRIQDEFTDIILENFPIKGTAEKIGRAERDAGKGFDAKDVMPEGTNKKNQRLSKEYFLLSFQGFFYRSCGFLEFDKFLFNVKPGNIFNNLKWEG